MKNIKLTKSLVTVIAASAMVMITGNPDVEPKG